MPVKLCLEVFLFLILKSIILVSGSNFILHLTDQTQFLFCYKCTVIGFLILIHLVLLILIVIHFHRKKFVDDFVC